MTAPNREAFEAVARVALARGRMAARPGYPKGTTWENINQIQRDHWLGEVSQIDVESVAAAMPFLAPQPSQSDEERARDIAEKRYRDDETIGWLTNAIVRFAAAVRGEATIAANAAKDAHIAALRRSVGNIRAVASTGDGSRTFDKCIADLSWIDDECRAALEMSGGVL